MTFDGTTTDLERALRHTAQELETHLTLRLSMQPSTGERDRPERLMKAMCHALLGGGKRFRAFLVCETASLLGVDRQCAINVAQSVECLHAYSLVHDDLPAMDDDDLRRGKPTVHKAFDEATAILAGDALQTLAFEMLAEPKTHIDANVRCQLITRLAQASGMGGMVGGQMLDLEAEGRYGAVAHSRKTILHLQSLKTGALIAYCAQAGAILAQSSPEHYRALSTYGETLGAIFQIADDLLDVESTPEMMGKSTAKDANKGKGTLIDVEGREAARHYRDTLCTQALEALSVFDERANRLRAAIFYAAQRTH
jgi:farnesyl diphosphate synthase